MKELQQKQKIRRALYSLPSLVIMLFVAGVLIKGAWGVMVMERESAAMVRDLEAQAVALGSREAELEGNIERLRTPAGVEEEIRDKFSVAREGEFVAIIVDEKERASTTEKTTGEIIWGWWNVFKGLWGN